CQQVRVNTRRRKRPDNLVEQPLAPRADRSCKRSHSVSLVSQTSLFLAKWAQTRRSAESYTSAAQPRKHRPISIVGRLNCLVRDAISQKFRQTPLPQFGSSFSRDSSPFSLDPLHYRNYIRSNVRERPKTMHTDSSRRFFLLRGIAGASAAWLSATWPSLL